MGFNSGFKGLMYSYIVLPVELYVWRRIPANCYLYHQRYDDPKSHNTDIF